MKKTILIIVVLVIVAIGGGIYYVLTNLDGLVKQAIEKYGSETTQTAVRVQGVNVRLQQASAAISGLTVANPPGFNMPYAFSLGKIATRLDVKASDRHHIVIDDVQIKTPQVFYEVNADRQGNLNLLKDKLMGTSGKAGASKPAAGSQGSSSVPNITIRKFEFADAALHATLVPINNKKYKLELPSFTLTNLHGTPQQITRQVMNQLIARAREEIRKKGIDAELDKARARLKQQADTEKAKLKQKMDSRVEQEKSKAEDKLKSLFGK
ncbi:MAG: hypothetical protein P8Z75_12465 [Gammaproteobacteria bacterium]